MIAQAALTVVVICSGIVEVVPPVVRPSKRLMFLVDVSGSMEGEKFSNACQAVIDIAGQPVDEMEMALFRFDDDHARWPGPKRPPRAAVQAAIAPDAVPAPKPKPTPPGWAALPSKDAIDQASRWLATHEPDGGTRIIPVLEAALAEPRKQLTLVLVTDGQFYQERTETILAEVEKAQKARVEKGYGRAVILVYGVGDSNDCLKQLGIAGKGGFYRKRKAVRPDPEPQPPAGKAPPPAAKAPPPAAKAPPPATKGGKK